LKNALQIQNRKRMRRLLHTLMSKKQFCDTIKNVLQIQNRKQMFQLLHGKAVEKYSIVFSTILYFSAIMRMASFIIIQDQQPLGVWNRGRK
jgi:hypothetical protein